MDWASIKSQLAGRVNPKSLAICSEEPFTSKFDRRHFLLHWFNLSQVFPICLRHLFCNIRTFNMPLLHTEISQYIGTHSRVTLSSGNKEPPFSQHKALTFQMARNQVEKFPTWE